MPAKTASKSAPYHHMYSSLSINSGGPLAAILSEHVLNVTRQNEKRGMGRVKEFYLTDIFDRPLADVKDRQVGYFHTTSGDFDLDLKDNDGTLLLEFRRKVYFGTRTTLVVLPDGTIIGKCVKKWRLSARHYALYIKEADMGTPADYVKFAKIYVDESGTDFPVTNPQGQAVAFVRRAFLGYGKKIGKRTGTYVMTMEPAGLNGMGLSGDIAKRGLTLDQKAILLANTVCVDYDFCNSGEHV